MSCKLAFRLTGMLLLIWASRPAPAQEFSAEMVRQKPEGTPTTKVSVSHNMARFEVAGQTKKSFVIVNLAQRTSSMVLTRREIIRSLRSGSHSFVDSPAPH